jgi:PAS domain S-box-containing protein
VGKSLREFIAPALQHQFDAYLERIRQSPTDHGRLRVVTRTGEERIWLYRNSKYEEAPGCPPYVLGHAVDITERVQVEQALKQAHEALERRVAERTAAWQRANTSLKAEIEERKQVEEALRQSEQRFRQLVEGSIQGIMIHRAGAPVFANQAYATIYGYDTPEEILRVDNIFQEIIAPEDRARLESYYQARLRGEAAPTHYTCRGVRRDSRKIWVENSVNVVTWRGESAIQCTVVDISERQRTEAALRASEDLNRRIVEAVPSGIVQVSPEGCIVHANAEAQRFLGLAYDDLMQHFVADFAPQLIWENGSPCATEDHPITQCLATDQPQSARTIGVRLRDGTVAWAVFTAIPLHDTATGETRGAVVTFLDITERKQMEEERQRLEGQLHQMQKMEAIGTLAGGIAHEFNNMLTAILGFTQLASARLPAMNPVAPYLQAVETAGQRAQSLVQQLLTFSHQKTHDRKPLSLTLVIQEALTLLRVTLPKTIDIRQRMGPASGLVLADAMQMYQVLMNLCTNAEYAMRETGGILEISLDDLEVDAAVAALPAGLQPGSYVRMRVRDTGVGMSEEVVGRIFEPFFTTKGIGEGTGMGLAIVHGIVSSHNGAMTVESVPGIGSTLTLYLPRMVPHAARTTDPPKSVMPQGTGCILLVDDEDILVRLGEGLLQHLGYEVVAHTSSLEALNTFQREPHRFDIVITDQTMPAMTGTTLVEELRCIRPDIPIILCTGFSHQVNAEKAQALGVDAFVMKPGVTQELAVTIQRVLQKRGF